MHRMMEITITDPMTLQWLKVANTSTSLLMFLVNDTLDYFQIKSGKFVRQDKIFRLENLINSSFEMIAYQMKVKGL